MVTRKGIIMRRLLAVLVAIVVLVGVALAATGVLYVQSTEDKASITIDKKGAQEKTQEAVDKARAAGGEILDKTGKALHQAGESLRPSSENRQVGDD